MDNIFYTSRVIFFIALVLLLLGLFGWFHITNPYAKPSIVGQPFVTEVEKGRITFRRARKMHAHQSRLLQFLIYYGKFCFLIVQNAYFGSSRAPATTVEGILDAIHRLRFDPSKPYLISGDHFSVLYVRNLGVFYNSLLNPHTARSQQDWENRQRIYLQSALYALEAFSQTNSLATTLVPFGRSTVLLTQVHPGSIASDSMYGLLYALYVLQDGTRYSNAPFELGTVETTQKVIAARSPELRRLVEIYLDQVRDPHTKLLRPKLDMASARDGALRDRSFYDSVILWKTLDLAKRLNLLEITPDELQSLRQQMLTLYWNAAEGHFRDDLGEQAAVNYSSDWLIVFPTGFLDLDKEDDLRCAERCVAYIQKQGLDRPFPIRYQAVNADLRAPWAVRTFVPNYGGDAIWSYWGAQYLTLLAELARRTGNKAYQAQAVRYRDIYHQKMIQYGGFPETFRSDGTFLQNAVYKSIRQTGWVVQFEEAEWLIRENARLGTQTSHNHTSRHSRPGSSQETEHAKRS